jgi:aminopeptidase
MKALTFGCISVVVSLSLCSFCSSASAQDDQMDKQQSEIAQKVVTVSVKVNPGEVVVVSGGNHALPLMEAVSIEASKVGGRVAPILVTTDRVQRFDAADLSEQYLGQASPMIEWLKTIDVWISTPDTEDPKAVLNGVPDTRLAKASRSNEAFRSALNHSKVRELFIAVPTKTDADLVQVNWNAYQEMMWNAINADYSQIADKGNQLKKILENAKTVNIISPAGTNFNFSLGKREVFVNAGMVAPHPAEGTPFLGRAVSLPGGNVTVAPRESSANGKVVAPKDTCRPYEHLTGATYEFKNGKMNSFKAEGNPECFQTSFAAYGGDKDMFSTFQIGLNPALKVMEGGSDYRPGEAAGMVFISIGNNQLWGGKNKTDFFWSIPVVKATVEVDGKTVVKDGQLVF